MANIFDVDTTVTVESQSSVSQNFFDLVENLKTLYFLSKDWISGCDCLQSQQDQVQQTQGENHKSLKTEW